MVASNTVVPAKLIPTGVWLYTQSWGSKRWKLAMNDKWVISIHYNTEHWVVGDTETDLVDPGVQGLRDAMRIAETTVLTGAL